MDVPIGIEYESMQQSHSRSINLRQSRSRELAAPSNNNCIQNPQRDLSYQEALLEAAQYNTIDGSSHLISSAFSSQDQEEDLC